MPRIQWPLRLSSQPLDQFCARTLAHSVAVSDVKVYVDKTKSGVANPSGLVAQRHDTSQIFIYDVITEWLEKGKSVSKAVDENGEPKVEMRTVNGNEIPVFVNGESIISATDNIGAFNPQAFHQIISPGITGKSAVKQGLAHDSRYVRVFPDYQDFSRDLQAFMRALLSLSEIPGMKVRAPKLSEEEAERLTKEEQQALVALNKLEEAVQKTGENAYKAELERLLAEAAKGKDLSKAGEVELRYEIAEENEKHLFSVAEKAEDAYRKANAEKFKDAKKVASIATKARQKASNQLLAIADKMVERMTRNLLFLFDRVSSEIRNRARLWYVGANKTAQAWAKDYKLRLRQTAAIIAVFSPRNDWFNNMSQAERTMDIYFFATGLQTSMKAEILPL